MAPCDIVLGILSYALTIQFLLRTEILKEMLFCKGRGEKSLAELFLLQPLEETYCSQRPLRQTASVIYCDRTEGDLSSSAPHLVLNAMRKVLTASYCIQLRKSQRWERAQV